MYDSGHPPAAVLIVAPEEYLDLSWRRQDSCEVVPILFQRRVVTGATRNANMLRAGVYPALVLMAVKVEAEGLFQLTPQGWILIRGEPVERLVR